MVATLQQSAGEAVSAMQQGQTRAEQSADQAQLAKASLSRILDAVNTITDMSAQIATAAEEQTSVNEEINRNVVNISTISDNTSQEAANTSSASTELAALASELKNQVSQFKV